MVFRIRSEVFLGSGTSRLDSVGSVPTGASRGSVVGGHKQDLCTHLRSVLGFFDGLVWTVLVVFTSRLDI